tara:strand:- start:371 stop:1093 length:723 start_codon:yes stop_codon:yes gene_type:complete
VSTIKADAITASTGTNTNIGITGKGSGKVKLGDGNLLFPDADGSANQYIKTDGSANLAFATLPTGGSLVYLGEVTASASATVELESLISSTYNNYMIQVMTVHPASSNTTLMMRTSTNNGSAYRSTGDYYYHTTNLESSSASYVATAAYNGTSILISPPVGINAATSNMSGYFMLTNVYATHRLVIHGTVTGEGDGSQAHGVGHVGGGSHYAEAVNALQFFMSSGNMDTGTFRIYGIAES